MFVALRWTLLFHIGRRSSQNSMINKCERNRVTIVIQLSNSFSNSDKDVFICGQIKKSYENFYPLPTYGPICIPPLYSHNDTLVCKVSHAELLYTLICKCPQYLFYKKHRDGTNCRWNISFSIKVDFCFSLICLLW